MLHPFSVLQTVVLLVHRLKKGLAHNYLDRSACACPTRRELASYGIKLPSQRAAEEKAREAQRRQYEGNEQYSDDEIDAMQQDELARQFAQTQQQRYGEQYQHDSADNQQDEDVAAEANWLASLLKPSSNDTRRTTRRSESVYT